MLKIFLILLCVSSIWASSLKHVPGNNHVPFKPVKDLGPRIINGDQAVMGQFPWQVAIVVQSYVNSWFCGGTIISEEWILTAGHCVANGVSATVTVGSVTIPNRANEYSSAKLVLHENYNASTLTNDIGLIRLSKRLTFNDNVQPIVLSSKPLEAGVNIIVSGWGLTHDANSDVSSNLNYITIRTITNQECEQTYGQGSISDSVVCAGFVGNTVQSPCSGDSGGPVIIDALDASSNPVHVAVVSFVNIAGCESGSPAGFTRTASYIDWIKSKSGVNAADFTKFSWMPSLVAVVVIKAIIIP